MLIRCPRCGFSQPQDRYCAKCGVDMQSYRPKDASFLQKMISNPFFHLTIFGSLLIYATLFLVQKKTNLLSSETVRTFATQSYQANSIEESEDPSSEEVDAASIVSQATAANQTANPTTESQVAPAIPPSDGETLGAAAANNEAKSLAAVSSIQPLTVRIYFTETRMPFLQRIIEEARNFGQYDDNGDIPFGVIQSMDSRINPSNSFLDIVEKVELPIDAAKGNLVKLFRGKHEGADNEIGLYTTVLVHEADNNLIKGEIDFLRTWIDKANVDKSSTDNKKLFDLAQRQGLFLANILPRTGLIDREGLFNVGLFRIMKSTPFRNQETESVIYFQFLRPGSQ